ncbi:30S ribosomal protein S7 [Methanothrix harundinacea]|uniref:30S ribosomal protein S7 n=1 Tax=Methanothrix harundinacea TaxID=301375 RepID=UPI00064F7906
MKIFNKWDPEEIEVGDLSIKRYFNLRPTVVMHSGGRHARQQFKKSEQHIVERLINKMMQGEDNTGKKMKTYKIVEEALDIVHQRTKENPLSVLAKAISNAGPREEVVRLKYGGITVPKAVDTAPQRRVDVALNFIATGAQRSAFKSKRSAASCLADEIIAASKGDVRSFAMNRKDSVERVAKAAR